LKLWTRYHRFLQARAASVRSRSAYWIAVNRECAPWALPLLLAALISYTADLPEQQRYYVAIPLALISATGIIYVCAMFGIGWHEQALKRIRNGD
jgi:hypothetical protein